MAWPGTGTVGHHLVTGGTGFIGRRLVEQLLEAGHEITCLVRRSSQADDLRAMGAELAEGDITDKASMREPMDGVDGVFHLAAWYKVGADDASPAHPVNVQGTRNVLELVDELDVPKAVYTSSLAVNSDTGGQIVDETYRHDGAHLSVYDRTKWQAHHEIAVPMMEDGLPLVIVMPGVTYGPGDTSAIRTFWRQHLTGDLPAIPRRTAYCWGHVDDTARGHRLAMEDGDPGETYIIAGHPRTLVEVFDVVKGITGRPAPKALPPWTFSLMAGGARMARWFTDLPEAYHPESLRVLAGNTYLGDNGKARQALGLEHRPLRSGLEGTLAWEAEQLGVELPGQ